MGALDDWRGRADGDGRPLEVTEVAVADEVAAAADLVKGKASRVPAALLRGVPRPAGDGRARDLVRSPADDLFRTAGTAEDLLAFLEGPPPRPGGPGPADPAAVDAVAAARAAARRAPPEVVAVPGAAAPPAWPPSPPPRRWPARRPCSPAAWPAPGRRPRGRAGRRGALRTLVLGLHALGIGAVFQAALRRPGRPWPARSASTRPGGRSASWAPAA